jgi:DNA processing protein
MNDYLKYFFSYTEVINFVQKLSLLSRFDSLETLFEFIHKNLNSIQFSKLLIEAKQQHLLLQKNSSQIVDYYHYLYPKLLKEIADPPIILFCKGNLDILQYDFFGVVGTRKPSKISELATSLLVDRISKHPKQGVVSGLAVGIDRIAMLNSLNHNLPTIGILGTGLEKEYPKENKDLYQKMKNSSKALIISENKFGETIGRWSFPKRNRIITGISKSLFLMEAPLQSGAISSVSRALEQNRDVIVFSDEKQMYNEGGEKLIREGASKLSLQDIANPNQFFHISELLPERFLDSPLLFSRLNRLEEEGYIQNLGGGYYKNINTIEQ